MLTLVLGACFAAMALHRVVQRSCAAGGSEAAAPSLQPSLRIATLFPYQGYRSTALAALREHGIQPETVEQVLLYRTEVPGTVCFSSLPGDVRGLAWNLWTDGLARGIEVRDVVHDGVLPEGRCLWFVLVRCAGGPPLMVCFVGPDAGASDYA